jgi:hypothetical protein
MDTSKANSVLGRTPEYTSAETLEACQLASPGAVWVAVGLTDCSDIICALLGHLVLGHGKRPADLVEGRVPLAAHPGPQSIEHNGGVIGP